MFERWKVKRATRKLKSAIRDVVKEAKGTPMEDVTRLEFQRGLETGDSSHRLGGAFALGEFGNPDDVEILVRALADEDMEVRLEAATALGKIGDVRAVSALEELRQRPGEDVRVRLAATKAETVILKKRAS